jgi:hypothetical protein
MVETRNAAFTGHLPWFMTEPGQSDTLLVLTGIFCVWFIATMGVLILRLFYMPIETVPQEQKAKYEVVAALCLIAMFTPGNYLWIAALLVALIDIPDFTPLFQRMADAARRIARSRDLVQARRTTRKEQPGSAVTQRPPISRSVIRLKPSFDGETVREQPEHHACSAAGSFVRPSICAGAGCLSCEADSTIAW